MTVSDRPLGGCGTKRLAACMAVALGLCGLSERVHATNWIVGVCTDGEDINHPFATWLRKAVAEAQNGDSIDLTKLTCSKITLTNGALPITVANLEIDGPTSHSLTIDGNRQDRVFNQTAAGGQLLLSNLTVQNGYTHGNGGCIQSAGTVHLFDNVTVNGCLAKYKSGVNGGKGGGISAPYVQTNQSTISNNVGGGIYASGTRTGNNLEDLYLVNSAVSGNTSGPGVIGNPAGYLKIVDSTISNNTSTTCGGIDAGNATNKSVVKLSYGNVIGNNAGQSSLGGAGGICAGYVSLFHSTVSGNKGGTGGILTGQHGPAYDLLARYSTIANNTAYNFDGGVESYSAAFYSSTISGNVAQKGAGGINANKSKFVNSTVSGNHGTGVGGINGWAVKLYNSTVAFNASAQYTNNGGIVVSFYCPPQDTCSHPSLGISMTSTIVANNVGGVANAESDVYVQAGVLSASKSLIMSSNMPSSSITADPQLFPLANNGGIVQTHALGLHSPALGVGSNPKNLGFDERGSGFPRTWANGQVDIGAFQTVDEIFKNGFESQ